MTTNNSINNLANLPITTISTSTATLATNSRNLINYGSGTCTLTLPAASVVGDVISLMDVTGKGFSIVQNTSQNIQFANISTTVTTGNLATSLLYDTLTITCTVANATWVVTSYSGNATLT